MVLSRVNIIKPSTRLNSYIILIFILVKLEHSLLGIASLFIWVKSPLTEILYILTAGNVSVPI